VWRVNEEEGQTSRKQLKSKPLIEAILEVRWGPPTPPPKLQADPHYKLLLGRFYDRVQTDYPVHEQLPTALLPDEMVHQTVQHRFRAGENDWPLVQLGPGIFTINETAKYHWPDFEARADAAVKKLLEAHPRVSDLRVESLILRYIDAVGFDYQMEDVFAFLQDKMRVSISLPEELFNPEVVISRPHNFAWQTTFQCRKPAGVVVLKFDTGQKETKPLLRWETMVVSSGGDVPEMPQSFDAWLVAAHEVIDDWFFKLIAGELEDRFSE
jgi:uncharacterized protein (TIGR04255 family)